MLNVCPLVSDYFMHAFYACRFVSMYCFFRLEDFHGMQSMHVAKLTYIVFITFEHIMHLHVAHDI